MKLLGEYLEHALQFERMAAEESDPKLKAAMESQAKAYRKMAAKRAKMLGLPESEPSREIDSDWAREQLSTLELVESPWQVIPVNFFSGDKFCGPKTREEQRCKCGA